MNQRGSIPGWMTLLSLGAMALLGSAAALTYWATTPQSSENLRDFILIQKGRNPTSVLDELYQKKLISQPKAIQWLGRLTHQWGKMKAGEYQLDARLTPWQVIQTLTSGQSIEHSLTIREGQNLFEVARDLEYRGFFPSAEFIARCRSQDWLKRLKIQDEAPSIEGYLFPDTYRLTRVMELDDIIGLFVKRFEVAWKPEWNQRASALGFSQHQVITLASIIEKETGHGPERPQISAVFHNRLKKRMPLQSDPTTIYGIWERWDGNLRRTDLQEKTPWNTYAISSLPVGPIGNPGIEGIRAALYPDTSDYLYFVSRNDGTHAFTRTYSEHLSEVRRFQLNSKAREGKSWRDLTRERPRGR